MKQPQLNPDLLGCPLYRRLMPRRINETLTEVLFFLVVGGMDLGAIWLNESREVHNDVDIAKKLGMYFIIFMFTLVCLLVLVYEEHRKRAECQKRAERLSGIPEADFWALEQEISMAELQFGSYCLLRDYLYAPGARLLIRYEHIATWQFGDFFSPMSGRLEKQFLDIVEADGFKTQIFIKKRTQLVREQDKAKVMLDYHILKAKYPNGSPYDT